MNKTFDRPIEGVTVRGCALGLSILAAASCASAKTASAADDTARAAMDRMRYARSFDEIHDRLAAEEAARAAPSAAPAPWTSAGTPPPKMTAREVPAAYRATVAYPSPGSWREAGDACTMSAAGTVRVLGSTPDLGTLVRYGRPGAATTAGSESCGDGTMAFVPTDVLFAWPSPGASEAERREVGARLATVAGRILSDAHVD